MKIRVLKTIEGAKEAEGLAVVIDVFRAFSLESYLFAAGARRIYPAKDLEEARAIAAVHGDGILVGKDGAPGDALKPVVVSSPQRTHPRKVFQSNLNGNRLFFL